MFCSFAGPLDVCEETVSLLSCSVYLHCIWLMTDQKANFSPRGLVMEFCWRCSWSCWVIASSEYMKERVAIQGDVRWMHYALDVFLCCFPAAFHKHSTTLGPSHLRSRTTQDWVYTREYSTYMPSHRCGPRAITEYSCNFHTPALYTPFSLSPSHS